MNFGYTYELGVDIRCEQTIALFFTYLNPNG